jgi:hypothetical protein
MFQGLMENQNNVIQLNNYTINNEHSLWGLATLTARSRRVATFPRLRRRRLLCSLETVLLTGCRQAHRIWPMRLVWTTSQIQDPCVFEVTTARYLRDQITSISRMQKKNSDPCTNVGSISYMRSSHNVVKHKRKRFIWVNC